MKRNRNKILITILVITIILLILCVIYVMYQMNTQHKEQDDYSKLASSVAPSLAEEVTSPSIDETLKYQQQLNTFAKEKGQFTPMN